jgi:hypothetical protein
MTDSEMSVFDFGPAVKETFTHVVAIGDRANSILSRLRADLGEKFEHYMLTIEEGSKYVRVLVGLVDETATEDSFHISFSHLMSEETTLFIIDIGEHPSSAIWSKAESYLWVPKEKQYDNVRNLFWTYHNNVLNHGLLCFDFNDWEWSVRGKKKVKTYVLRGNEETVFKLLPTWRFDTSRSVFLFFIGLPKGIRLSERQMNSVNENVFKKLGDDAYLHWNIYEREDSHDEISFTLLQFIPID